MPVISTVERLMQEDHKFKASAYTPKKVSFSFLFAVLGLELRAFTLSHSTNPIFCDGFFEIGSLELFAWAGF
jgi:hypothetical protein